MNTNEIIAVIGCAIIFGFIIYMLYKKFDAGDPRELEKIIDKVGFPEGYRKINNKIETLKIENLLYSLVSSSGYSADQFSIYFLFKKKETKEMYFLDAKYRLRVSDSGITFIFISAFCFPGSLDAPNMYISSWERIGPIFEQSRVVNPVEGFNKHFRVFLRNRSKKMRLNTEIQKLLLSYCNKYPLNDNNTLIYFGKEGLIIKSAQNSEKDKLTQLCRVGEQLVEIINKSDFVGSEV
ncbi:MAG: hypothetical protein GTO45_05100 [Candidatus Aminicenantes bacterium]|nr:hypothetical protein [Candidatus Aminicenantes bacterium]NIM78130.1 hypothetical protein [Candidatus Aminicenantes bacterium]NIN17448.1 hypothetical protein [Candidatus Aminicenantes bacterium]NIN41344.1 hypothetical protein [Candidatus Aminicenantes bacterium]NIN84114.1 hypothetical protein [Candidatus Aminicenantes bacterium]